MKKLFLTLALMFIMSMPVYANAGNVAYATVNGLICDFCAQALDKVFSREEAVDNIDVNMDTKIVTISFKESKSLSDEEISQLILDAGYDVNEISRGEESE
ncbi:MAG: heavy-metal-associated domain-containing protein [Alphaproteobacteria bacterium]